MSILDLFYVPKCVHCRARLDRHGNTSLCPSCIKKWEGEKSAPCPTCGQPIDECWCGIELDEKHVILEEYHLSYYKYSEDTVTRSYIFNLKRRENKNHFDNMAKELASLIEENIYLDDLCIVNVPRSPKAIRQYGFDQTKILATKIASILDIEYVDALIHTGNAVQKKLGQKQRIENAKKSYKLNDKCKPSLKNKDVIIIDDLVTSGASVTRCASQVKLAKPNDIYVVCIAKSY